MSTTDYDRDADRGDGWTWSGGNAADNHMPATSWPFKGDGWGWHNSAHSCSLWDRVGSPYYASGWTTNCWTGGQKCKADRVELWIV